MNNVGTFPFVFYAQLQAVMTVDTAGFCDDGEVAYCDES